MGTVPVFASATQAMQMVRAGLDYLAAADATAMPAGEQARSLRALEQASSVATAARTSILGAYTAGQGYTADADYSPRSWLIHKAGVTRGAAVAYTAWVKRAEAHPRVAAALAAREITESVARTLCLWTGKLPAGRRQEADKILADAAVCGLGLADLAGLFAETCQRYRAEGPDQDKDQSFEDRALRLVTTLGGAGVLHGDLSPECAGAVQAVLDALSAPADAEDTRTREQRCHDALGEAMRRLGFCIVMDTWATHRQTALRKYALGLEAWDRVARGSRCGGSRMRLRRPGPRVRAGRPPPMKQIASWSGTFVRPAATSTVPRRPGLRQKKVSRILKTPERRIADDHHESFRSGTAIAAEKAGRGVERGFPGASGRVPGGLAGGGVPAGGAGRGGRDGGGVPGAR